MLHDILMIDDDFESLATDQILSATDSSNGSSSGSAGANLTSSETSSIDNSSSGATGSNPTSSETGWPQISKTPTIDLYLYLLQNHLRVAFSTGSVDDIKQLPKENLSGIKYLICDLILDGMNSEDGHESINREISARIRNVLAKAKSINQNKVEICIFSEHAGEDTYGKRGLKELRKYLNKSEAAEQIASVGPLLDKSDPVTKKIINKLRRYHIHQYHRNLLTSKTIDVENCICDKVTRDKKCNKKKCSEKKFSQKIKLLKDKYVGKEAKQLCRKLDLLRRIRNHFAHSERNEKMKESLKSDFKKDYYRRLSIPNKFNNFKNLMRYVEEIHRLMEEIDALQP